MADYVVRVEASTEEAEKKLKRVDKQVNSIDRNVAINVNLPSIGQAINTLEQFGKTAASVGATALDLSRKLNIGPGAVINDLDQLFGIVTKKGQQAVGVLEALSKATPTNILGTAFNAASDKALALSKNIASVGYEIFGLTQSVNVLKQAFGGLFDETIGREIRLQESLLRTRTTLASTADVAVNGKRLTDPYEALIALEKPVEDTIQNIRRRSLDIAGTTSEAIVQVFGVVASQVGAFGGTLKDAEDLAITFAGALGTIGMSDPMLATQEIRSILTGNIDQNSVLARSLGLTNDEITKAKASTEGLVAFLQRRLAAFSAGQSIAAKGFAGITSNIQEVQQEALRSLGKPFLQPLLDGLTAIYQRLQLVFDQILGIADGVGRIGSTVFSGILSGIKGAPVLQGFSERDQIDAFTVIEDEISIAAIKIQQVIDSIRPIIAGLANEFIKATALMSSGLLKLAEGLVYFKFEQFKIIAINIANIGEILNSTILPVLSEVLKIYGRILELPIVNYLTQINNTFQILEKVGVLPFARLLFFAGAFAASIKTAIGWVNTFATAIRTGFKFILDTAAGAIDGIGAVVNRVGKAIVIETTKIVATVIFTIATAIKQVGVMLVGLGAAIQSQFPAFGRLGVAISSVGKSFIRIEEGAARAKQGLTNFTLSALEQLARVENAAGRLANQTRNLGVTVGSWLGSKIKELIPSLVGAVKNFVVFNAQLLLLQLAITGLTDLWARYRRGQEEATERTKAEVALKRLTTVYADLGENASETAKRLKQANEDIVNQRFDALTSRLQTMREEYSKTLKQVSDIQKKFKTTDYGVSKSTNLGSVMMPGIGGAGSVMGGVPAPELSPGTTTPASRELAAAKGREQKLRAQYKSAMEELRAIEDYYQRSAQVGKDKEDVQILARERKDIESAIKDFRKEIEKELRDERFKTEREAAQLQQSFREEVRRTERVELERRLSREAEGLTGVRAEISRILGDYERGIFDAQTEAQRRQFEAVQARENLEKAVADYKLKLEEQTYKMRMRLGEFNQKVSDYEKKQQDYINKQKIKTALQAAAIQAERFVLTPEEIGKFKQAAADAGVSDTQALSLLKTPGVIDQLGIVPDGNYDGIINAMLKHPKIGPVLSMKQAPFIQELNNRLTNYGVGAGRYTYDTSVAELNNQRFLKTSIAPPAPVKGFDDFSKETAGFVAERQRLGERILGLTNKLNDFLLLGSTRENMNKAKDALANPNLLSSVPSLQQAQDQVDTATRQLDVLSNALANGATKVDALTSSLSDFDESVTRSIENFVLSRLKSYNSRLPKNKQRSDSAVKDDAEFFAEQFNESIQESIKQGKPVITQKLGKTLSALGEGSADLFNVLLQNIVDTRRRIKAVTPLMEREARLLVASQYLNEIPNTRNLLQDRKLSVLNELGTLAAGDSPLKQRRFEGEMINLRRTLEAQINGSIAEPKVQQALAQLNAETTQAYEGLGRFDEGLKRATERIATARELAQSVTEGYKKVLIDLRDGKSWSDAVVGMLEGIGEKVTSTLLDFAVRPITNVFEQIISKTLKWDTAEEVAMRQRDLLTSDNSLKLKENNTAMTTLTTSLGTLTLSVDNLRTAITTGGATSQAVTTGTQAATGFNWTDAKTTFNTSPINFSPPKDFAFNADPSIWQQDTKGFSESFTSASYNFQQIADKSQKIPKDITNLQKATTGVVTAFTGAALAFAGIEQMSKGGTYNTLMGIGAIFGSIASITSMFVPGMGIFGGKRAAGGPVKAMSPYLVGEKGPELFVPSLNGEVISNDKTKALTASRDALPVGTPETDAALETLGQGLSESATALNVTREALTRPGSLSSGGEAGSDPNSPTLNTTSPALTDPNSPFISATREALVRVATPALNATRQALASSTTYTRERQTEKVIAASLTAQSQPLNVQYEASIINSVEYVTAAQFQRGLSDAAERGRALTLGALKNSVKARRQIGI